MSENTRERSGRRRRGGRRRSDNRGDRNERGDRYEPRSNSNPSPTPKPEAKPSFWQKLISFFTGKSKSSGNGSSSAPSRKYPAYEPRNQRSGSTSTEVAKTAPEPRPTRKPEAVEVTTPKLYVGNLSFDAGESDLLELFNGVGKVQNAEIVTHKDTEKSKGFAFVTMASVEEAKRAVNELHDKEFMTRKLVVSGAKTPPGR